jgi:hypothetical protein
MTIESQICDKILSIISEDVPSVKYKSFDKIKLSTSDFMDYELPAVQLWDISQAAKHERGRILVNWSISLELIMKSNTTGVASQKELWDLRRQIQLALWKKPNLEIPGVVHLVYNSNITDLHLVEPYYIARLDFDVLFYDNLTGSC